MQLHFLGAIGTVTGSCYLLEVGATKILIDCGMFQGQRELEQRNYQPFAFNPQEIDVLLLTHAHIDHCGLLPKLVNGGFRGKIYATKPTAELCSILLPDSAKIQEEELSRVNRKRLRSGLEPYDVLYTPEDVAATLPLFVPIEYRETIFLSEGIEATFYDAGHILGSSFVVLDYEESGKKNRIAFSGDVGNRGQRIVRDPDPLPDNIDVLLMESTYGSRCHKPRAETIREFQQILEEAMHQSGNILIPAFAVERTPEILYELGELSRNRHEHSIPVFLDSPLAIKANIVFRKNSKYFDEETQELLKNGQSPLDMPEVHATTTPDESKQINNFKRSLIIAGSGMCNAGRIKHHLKHHLWKKETHVIFVGYQASGTLGRRIVDGEKIVKIFGEDIVVRAHIHTLGGFSAHADQTELMHWIGTSPSKPKHVFLVHGEDNDREILRQYLVQDGYTTSIPTLNEITTL